MESNQIQLKQYYELLDQVGCIMVPGCRIWGKYSFLASVVSDSVRPHRRHRAHQAPPSLGLSRQEHWSGLPFPSPGNLPEIFQGSNPLLPHWQAGSLPLNHHGKPLCLANPPSHQPQQLWGPASLPPALTSYVNLYFLWSWLVVPYLYFPIVCFCLL